MARARASNAAGAVVLTLLVAASPVHGDEFQLRFDEAERLRAKAAAAGAEWRDTGALLDEARAAAGRGETGKALALVEQARFQAAAAISQAEREAEAWKKRVVRSRDE